MTLRVADMPAVYRKWLDGVEPAWTVLEAERIDALLGEPPFEDGAIRLAIDLTDDEIACSPMVQNALVLVRAAGEADGLELTARGNLNRGDRGGHALGNGLAGAAVRGQVARGKAVEGGSRGGAAARARAGHDERAADTEEGQAAGWRDGSAGPEGPAGAPAGKFLPGLLLAGEPRPVRRTRVRLVAPGADRSGALVAGDHGRQMAGYANADAAVGAAR